MQTLLHIRQARLAAAVAIAFAPVALDAQAKTPPSAFSGTWALDVSRSTGYGLPSGMSMTVRVDADHVTISEQVTSGGTAQPADHYAATVDSVTAADLETPDGTKLRRTIALRRDGPALVFTIVTEANGSSLEQIERWTVSPDGSVLTIASHMSAQGRSIDRQLVWGKST